MLLQLIGFSIWRNKPHYVFNCIHLWSMILDSGLLIGDLCYRTFFFFQNKHNQPTLELKLDNYQSVQVLPEGFVIQNASDNGTITVYQKCKWKTKVWFDFIQHKRRGKIYTSTVHFQTHVHTHTHTPLSLSLSIYYGICTPNINPADIFHSYKAMWEGNMEAVNPPTLKPWPL